MGTRILPACAKRCPSPTLMGKHPNGGHLGPAPKQTNGHGVDVVVAPGSSRASVGLFVLSQLKTSSREPYFVARNACHCLWKARMLVVLAVSQALPWLST